MVFYKFGTCSEFVLNIDYLIIKLKIKVFGLRNGNIGAIVAIKSVKTCKQIAMK